MSEWAKDFDLLVQKINQCLNSYDRSNGISSIDVLFPFDYNLTSLLQLRAANPNSNYLKAINEFLFNGSDSIQRSLYYQEYDGFFKHKSSKQVSISSNSNVLKFYDPQIIPDPKNKKIKDLRLLDDFWEAFCQAIFKHGVGSTVFWCLIKIDPSNHTSKIYASAYLVIKHPICDENNIAIIHIDKLLKEYLTRHTINILFSGILENTTKSATSRIINRNYAHHIGSHVSHRATADKIYERVFGNYDLKIEEKDFATILKSIVEMENRLTRYKDERNEFISGIESNTHPVPVMFYKDIIQPFIENSLLMDNIAKSEGICWESEDALKNDGKVKENGISKLRIRVFYHKDIVEENGKTLNCELKDCCCAKEVPCLYKNDENKTISDRLSFSDLGIDDNWLEMMAVYNFENETQTNDKNNNKERKNTCVHRLPYFKKLLGKDGKFYRNIAYTLSDIEVAMPGTLGAQSIYSLLENHIRNTAKHAPSKTMGSLMPVNIIIKISKRKGKGVDDPDYYNMELTSNIPTIHDKSHKGKIEKALKEPIDGDASALGFADMRINATLIAFREIKQENLVTCIEEPKYYPKIPVNGESISYCMVLTRPCKIIFVGNSYRKFDKEELINAGIRQYDTMNDCIEVMGNNPRAFEFAIVHKDVFDEPENHDLFLKSLPWRVIVSSEKEGCSGSLQKFIELRRVTLAPGFKIEDSNNPDQMLNKCWDAWLRNRWQPPYTLNMYFDRNMELDERYSSKAEKLDQKLSFSFHLGSKDSKVFEKKNSFDVFYDRHGNFRDNINDNLHKKSLLQLSWEHFDKNNPDFDLIHNDKLKIPEISFSKLIESGIHKILVIDERAREAGLKSMGSFTYLGEDDDDETGENNPYLRFAMATRVFIADSFVINDEEVLYDTGEISSEDSGKFFQVNLKSKPEKHLSFNGQLSDRPDFNSLNVFSKFDTLIIHRTMLSKVDDNDLFDILDKNFPNIIITTGGGTLKYEPEIMNRSRMLPYAAVKKYLLNGAIAKNSITNLI